MIALPEWLNHVRIAAGPVEPALEGATARGVLWQASRGRFLLEVPEVARYRVESGERITVDSVPQAAAGDVARFFRMAPLAALLYQRGLLALHAASAVTPDGASVLIAGDSGAGKSTLLGALLERGWSMLGDELAPVDLDERGEPVVLPTFPEVRLWPDALERSAPGTAEGSSRGGDAAAASSERRKTVSLDRFASGARRLRAIYWLSVHNREGVETQEVEGTERFRAFGTLAYNSHVADALLDRTAYFRLAAAVTQSVPLRRLRRPRGGWSVGALAEKIGTWES